MLLALPCAFTLTPSWHTGLSFVSLPHTSIWIPCINAQWEGAITPTCVGDISSQSFSSVSKLQSPRVRASLIIHLLLDNSLLYFPVVFFPPPKYLCLNHCLEKFFYGHGNQNIVLSFKDLEEREKDSNNSDIGNKVSNVLVEGIMGKIPRTLHL